MTHLEVFLMCALGVQSVGVFIYICQIDRAMDRLRRACDDYRGASE